MSKSKLWFKRRDLSSKQRSPQHEREFPSDGQNNLVSCRFVTADEFASPSNHASKEILILTCSKFGSEGLFTNIENASFEKYVSSAAFSPINDQASLVGGTIVKPSFDDPLWWLLLEIGFHRSKHAFGLICLASFE